MATPKTEMAKFEYVYETSGRKREYRESEIRGALKALGERIYFGPLLEAKPLFIVYENVMTDSHNSTYELMWPHRDEWLESVSFTSPSCIVRITLTRERTDNYKKQKAVVEIEAQEIYGKLLKILDTAKARTH